MNAAYKQVASGAYIDLVDPKACDIYFKKDIAEPLSRLARFTGHVDAGIYSVAQHCIIGADHIFKETSDKTLAAYFLLNDAHEAYIGDITSPMIKAIDLIAEKTKATPAFAQCLALLKHGLDKQIHAAARLEYPLPKTAKDIVKRVDLELLALEKRQFLKAGGELESVAWGNLKDVKGLKIKGKIQIKPWTQTADDYIERLEYYAPNAIKKPHRKKAA
jgi:hypothetical protein